VTFKGQVMGSLSFSLSGGVSMATKQSSSRKGGWRRRWMADHRAMPRQVLNPHVIMRNCDCALDTPDPQEPCKGKFHAPRKIANCTLIFRNKNELHYPVMAPDPDTCKENLATCKQTPEIIPWMTFEVTL